MYWIPAAGNYGAGNNWSDELTPLVPRGELPSGPTFQEFASISNNGAATVSSAIPTNPGGVVLGELAGTTGTLNITGGSLTSEAVLPTNTGNIEVGRAGRGYLNASGGTLTAPQLIVAGENLTTGSGLSAANFSGTATVNVTSATFGRLLRTIGPSVNFSAGGISLQGTNNLTAEITAATHSPLKATGGLSLDGNLTVQYNIAPTPGQSWNLADAGSISGAFDNVSAAGDVVTTGVPAPALGEAYRLRQVAGGTNGRLLQVVYDRLLVLRVNRGTGEITVRNPLGGAIAIDGYSVLSPTAGSLLTSYKGISGAPAGDVGWEKPPTNTINNLSELKEVGTFSPVSDVTLGNGFDRDAVFTNLPNNGLGINGEDLVFEYRRAGVGTVRGQVEYIGTPYRNDLVLTIDPVSGQAQLKNDTLGTLSIDGYAITSTGGAMKPANGDWFSFQDHGFSGWQESAPTVNALTELNPVAPMTLSPGQVISMGDLFNTALPATGIALKFIRGTDTAYRFGTVVFESLVGGVLGDYNGNGVVDAADYVQWRNGGPLQNDPTPGVQAADYDFWRARFGNTAGAGSGGGLAANTQVPEPGTIALILIGGVAMVRCRMHGLRWMRQRVFASTSLDANSEYTGGTEMLWRSKLRGLAAMCVVAAVWTASVPTRAQLITVVNPDFDGTFTATGKTEWWDATGAIVVPTPIAGWEAAGPGSPMAAGGPIAGPGDSGVEFGGDISSPGARMYLAGFDPAVYQTTSHIISANQGFRFRFDAVDVYTDPANVAVVKADLFYLAADNTTRVSMGTATFGPLLGCPTCFQGGDVQGGPDWQTYSLIVPPSSIVPAAIGRPLGMQFDNISDTMAFGGVTTASSWVGMDNVKLDLVGNPGDVNVDGAVDLIDFGIIRDHQEQAVTTWNQGDLTGDDFVDLNDFRAWTLVAPPGMAATALASFAIPEPTSLALVVVAATAIKTLRRRRVTRPGCRAKQFCMAIVSGVVAFAFLAAAPTAQAQPITVTNFDFSGNGTTKTEFWDAASQIVPGIIPGWEPSGPGVQGAAYDGGGPVAGPGDSGVENDGEAGSFALYIAGLDPTVYQTTSHNIQAGKNYKLTFDSGDTFTSSGGESGFNQVFNNAVIKAWLYYGASRMPIPSATTADLLLPNPADPYVTFSITANSNTFPPAAIGQPIGIEFDNISNDRDLTADVTNSWIHIDNLRLAIVGGPGDVNNDGFTNHLDYVIIRDHFRTNVASRELGDLNGNGFVDLTDFGEWKDAAGSAAGSYMDLANGVIPEPGSMALALTGILVCASARLTLRQRSMG